MKTSLSFRWAAIKPENVDYNTFNEKLKEVREKKYERIKEMFGSRKAAVIKTYSFFHNDKISELRICTGYDKFERYIVKHCFDCDELKESSGITGMDAYNHVQDLFQQVHHTNTTLYKAFSGTKYVEQYKAIKHCVPKQIAYINTFSCGKVIDNCFKADVSSAFPSQMAKTLPTLHDCKIINGVAEPTEEYPFAFYTKSGHIKILNELDTHDMKNRFYIYYNEVYDDSVKDEITILCKVSEYNMKEEFEYMYSQRKVDVNNKMYMNACIGYFQRNKDPRLSLLSAVVIARNNNAMLNRIKQLVSQGNAIAYIATDSIVWRGKYSDVASNDKYLGSFTYEGINGKFFGRMIGAYQYIDEKGNLTTKCSYLKNDENKANIKFGDLPDPKYSVKLIVNKDGYIENIFG